ncbi:hypothetical protein ACIP5N_12005 [Streptomyces sp. NPDC088768]|uniref:hypothetical protein n=1 Tax=Streptomyces sp. NPDC088768 TaxID=3365894 RepID=UPI0037F90A05
MPHTAARPRRSGALAAASALSLGTLLLSACATPGTGGGRVELHRLGPGGRDFVHLDGRCGRQHR